MFADASVDACICLCWLVDGKAFQNSKRPRCASTAHRTLHIAHCTSHIASWYNSLRYGTVHDTSSIAIATHKQHHGHHCRLHALGPRSMHTYVCCPVQILVSRLNHFLSPVLFPFAFPSTLQTWPAHADGNEKNHGRWRRRKQGRGQRGGREGRGREGGRIGEMEERKKKKEQGGEERD